MRRIATPLLLLALSSSQVYAQSNALDQGVAPKGDAVAGESTDQAPHVVSAWSERGSSSRLFFMPVADSVGAYEATLSYEGSLLEERGLLSSAGVFALGIGSLAQIDYRHTSAIGIEGGNVPLPAVGVQLKLPIDLGARVPALAIAYRLGIAHDEGAAREKATDLYGVAHFVLPYNIDLHAGLRVTQASLQYEGRTVEATKWYPALGVTRQLGNTTAVLELGRAPQFHIEQGEPRVDSGTTGRLGLRWRVHPRVSLDASAGYLAAGLGTQSNELLAWDIRLGGEVFVPWGAVACKSFSLFCQ